MRRPGTGLSLISAVLAFVWSEHSVVMKGEERDAEATLVHATYIQYTICRRGDGEGGGGGDTCTALWVIVHPFSFYSQ